MLSLLLGAAIVLSAGTAAPQAAIRQVDFKNFNYPLSGRRLGHDRLEWLDTQRPGNPKRTIHLVNGTEVQNASGFVKDGKQYNLPYEGFTLQSVKFADLTGDGKDEAIVVLLYQTGGTQTTHYVYIYTLQDGKPVLLAYCHTGDRADFGLYGVSGSSGLLVFELLDPAKSDALCCSSGLVVRKFKWRGVRFETIGAPAYRSLQTHDP